MKLNNSASYLTVVICILLLCYLPFSNAFEVIQTTPETVTFEFSINGVLDDVPITISSSNEVNTSLYPHQYKPLAIKECVLTSTPSDILNTITHNCNDVQPWGGANTPFKCQLSSDGNSVRFQAQLTCNVDNQVDPITFDTFTLAEHPSISNAGSSTLFQRGLKYEVQDDPLHVNFDVKILYHAPSATSSSLYVNSFRINSFTTQDGEKLSPLVPVGQIATGRVLPSGQTTYQPLPLASITGRNLYYGARFDPIAIDHADAFIELTFSYTFRNIGLTEVSTLEFNHTWEAFHLDHPDKASTVSPAIPSVVAPPADAERRVYTALNNPTQRSPLIGPDNYHVLFGYELKAPEQTPQASLTAGDELRLTFPPMSKVIESYQCGLTVDGREIANALTPSNGQTLTITIPPILTEPIWEARVKCSIKVTQTPNYGTDNDDESESSMIHLIQSQLDDVEIAFGYFQQPDGDHLELIPNPIYEGSSLHSGQSKFDIVAAGVSTHDRLLSLVITVASATTVIDSSSTLTINWPNTDKTQFTTCAIGSIDQETGEWTGNRITRNVISQQGSVNVSPDNTNQNIVVFKCQAYNYISDNDNDYIFNISFLHGSTTRKTSTTPVKFPPIRIVDSITLTTPDRTYTVTPLTPELPTTDVLAIQIDTQLEFTIEIKRQDFVRFKPGDHIIFHGDAIDDLNDRKALTCTHELSMTKRYSPNTVRGGNSSEPYPVTSTANCELGRMDPFFTCPITNGLYQSTYNPDNVEHQKYHAVYDEFQSTLTCTIIATKTPQDVQELIIELYEGQLHVTALDKKYTAPVDPFVFGLRIPLAFVAEQPGVPITGWIPSSSPTADIIPPTTPDDIIPLAEGQTVDDAKTQLCPNDHFTCGDFCHLITICVLDGELLPMNRCNLSGSQSYVSHKKNIVTDCLECKDYKHGETCEDLPVINDFTITKMNRKAFTTYLDELGSSVVPLPYQSEVLQVEFAWKSRASSQSPVYLFVTSPDFAPFSALTFPRVNSPHLGKLIADSDYLYIISSKSKIYRDVEFHLQYGTHAFPLVHQIEGADTPTTFMLVPSCSRSNHYCTANGKCSFQRDYCECNDTPNTFGCATHTAGDCYGLGCHYDLISSEECIATEHVPPPPTPDPQPDPETNPETEEMLSFSSQSNDDIQYDLQCDCQAGFTGTRCESQTNCEDSAITCGVQGYKKWSTTTETCTCQCVNGYTGDDCSICPSYIKCSGDSILDSSTCSCRCPEPLVNLPDKFCEAHDNDKWYGRIVLYGLTQDQRAAFAEYNNFSSAVDFVSSALHLVTGAFDVYGYTIDIHNSSSDTPTTLVKSLPASYFALENLAPSFVVGEDEKVPYVVLNLIMVFNPPNTVNEADADDIRALLAEYYDSVTGFDTLFTSEHVPFHAFMELNDIKVKYINDLTTPIEFTPEEEETDTEPETDDEEETDGEGGQTDGGNDDSNHAYSSIYYQYAIISTITLIATYLITLSATL